MTRTNNTKVIISSTEAAVAQLKDIANLKQEHFVVLTLDQNKRLISKRTVFIGTLTSVVTHPREVFAGALEDRAASIIVAHNHPSGNPTPSKPDIEITQQFAAAGQIMGMEMTDHIIIAGKIYYSFLENEMILPRLVKQSKVA